MTSYIGFVPLIVLIGGAAAVFVLFRACDEISCAFGSLDPEPDARREKCRLLSKTRREERRRPPEGGEPRASY